ncbi:probable 28S rRNA (cytosine-C(5))-methyltransferase [Trichoplusia ni]|uniref:Probable 28S rRNA (Cytosine-C(5))-methyltransferase n=1 Tax=Trichoplusia ni TaxID=7111 RepID=A0A7E5WP81_TRINI|nr:probable 28S rRNA (cytosine-C(5))-methyltransferase [Trichoplusia ni]
MFEHSVKVPRHYKIAANIFKKVSTEGGSVKSLLYDDKLRHFRTNVLFALITETIKHAGDIDKIFENSKILENETRLDPWLAKILTAELLFGKKALPGKSKPEQTVLSYKDQFEKYISDHQDDLKTEVAPRPRYVRINTNLLTTSDAIRAFQDEGYKFIRCTSGSYADYLEQIQKLTEYDFTQDYHIKTIFVFAAGTKLHEHELYLENKIILQDKATAMAVHLLAPPPGSVVLDMCAAPGMKTTQLAAYMRNNGRIFAVERNEKRYQTLSEFVVRTGSTCVETFHKDSLEIKRGDMDDVEYILLDPSCSGSGMDFCVHNYIESTRLAKLTSLQEKFLKHAMNAFPKVKRIVYSTCSLFPEENERVITNVVKTSRTKWRVQDVKELLKGQWNNVGSGMYGSMGARCMYAKPDSDFTTGFFLAVLDRDPKDLQKSLDGEKAGKKEKKYKVENGSSDSELSSKKTRDVGEEVNGVQNDMEVEETKPKKKKKKDKEANENTEPDSTNVDTEYSTETSTKKKKKRKHDEPQPVTQIIEELNELAVEDEAPKKKKKKDKKREEENTESLVGNNIEEDSEVPKKKKKRKKDLDKTIGEETELTENQVKKKKSKKDDHELSESVNTGDTSEVSEAPKKKKKKNKGE